MLPEFGHKRQRASGILAVQIRRRPVQMFQEQCVVGRILHHDTRPGV